MESTSTINDEQNEELLCAEVILYDMLHHIFSYLNIFDLKNASSVCKSWYYTSKIEYSKRGPQVMVLQAMEDLIATGFSNVNSINKNEFFNDFKVSLRIKPTVGLFFTDGKIPPSADCDGVAYQICETHQWTQPKNCIYVAIEILGVSINNNIIGGEKNLSAAVFLPELPTIHYTTTKITSQQIKNYFKGTESILKDITDKLFTTKEGNPCFIIFIYHWEDCPNYENYHNHFLNGIFSIIKTRYCPGTYSLWGGAVTDIFTSVTNAGPLDHSMSFYAMSISGSSVKSWSLVLNYNLSDFEIKIKLSDFKKSVCLKASIAFLITPCGVNNIDRSRSNVFKYYFPTVKLITIFSNKMHAVFSLDSTRNEINPELKHINSYAYMILSYCL